MKIDIMHNKTHFEVQICDIFEISLRNNITLEDHGIKLSLILPQQLTHNILKIVIYLSKIIKF